MGTPILGMLGGGAWSVTDKTKLSYEQAAFYNHKNGDFPLCALLSMMKGKTIRSMEHNWWVYADEDDILEADGAFLAGDATLAVQDSLAKRAVKGSVILNWTKFAAGSGADYMWVIQDPTDDDHIVVQRNIQGTSALAVANNDELMIIGHAVSVGGAAATALSYSPTMKTQYLEVFSASIEIAMTTQKQDIYLDPNGPTPELRRGALEKIMRNRERAALFGIKSKTTTGALATADKPAYFSGGLVTEWIPTANRKTFATTVIGGTAYGTCTAEGLDEWFSDVFSVGSTEKFALVGPTANLVLTRYGKLCSEITRVPSDETYGMHIQHLITPGGDLYIKQHPQFSSVGSWKKLCVIVDPANLKQLTLEGMDLQFRKNIQNPEGHYTKHEWLYCGGILPGLVESHHVGFNLEKFVA